MVYTTSDNVGRCSMEICKRVGRHHSNSVCAYMQTIINQEIHVYIKSVHIHAKGLSVHEIYHTETSH